MLGNVKIGTKLTSGFLLVSLFSLILGVTGIVFAHTFNFRAKALQGPSNLQSSISAILNKHYQWRHELTETVASGVEFRGALDPTLCAFGKWLSGDDSKTVKDKETLDMLEKIISPHADIHRGAARVVELLKEGKKKEAEDIYKNEVMPKFNEIMAGMTAVCDRQRELMKMHEDILISSSQTAAIVMITLVVVCLLVSVTLGVVLSNSISKPLHATVNMIKEMSKGHLGARLKLNRKDEIGVMAKTMDMFADDLQNVVIGAMKRISAGDLSVEIKPKDNKDEISDTLKNMLESLNVVVGTMRKISEGDLSAEITLKGDKDEISDTLRHTVESLNVVVGVMKKISEGDLSSEIESKNERDVISVALKTTVESLRELIINDGGKVLQAAADKDLSQRLTSSYKGEFARMKNNINTVMQSLDNALMQVSDAVSSVANASNSISDGAQSLAEGSNEQAASLEEVSASLEEMSSMTKQNADISSQASVLASEARNAAGEGDASMKRMADAINKIKHSADNTAKIVRSINDIAFQTNLLALNAAVEAARAGEAGKGFAVVAEEVRNLAMRSADAAKDTADMIDESVMNANDGVRITEEVAGTLSQIVNRTGKVGGLIAEIAAASKEQAHGIEQVNTAVAQMNQVTQQNAANAEESASGAEELSGQALELENLVGTFKLSGNGNAKRQAAADGQSAYTRQRRKRGDHHIRNARAERAPERLLQAAATSGASGASGAGVATAVDPKEIIPLDDDDIEEMLKAV